MQTQPKFIFCPKVEEIPGVGIIIRTESPFFVGKPIRFDSPADYENFKNAYSPDSSVGLVKGYRMVIAFIGTLDNIESRVVEVRNMPENAAFNMDLMAQWYLNNVIAGQESRMKRYLI